MVVEAVPTGIPTLTVMVAPAVVQTAETVVRMVRLVEALVLVVRVQV
jgi:hypothetical protein